MLIYEVNIEPEDSIREEFLLWLKEHIREMLEIDGFEKAQTYFEQNSKTIIVHYYVSSQSDLDIYINKKAPLMRAQGQNLFKDQLKIQRRVLISENY